MSELVLSQDNQFNRMKRDDFLALLQEMGINYEDGDGEVIYEEITSFEDDVEGS